MVLKQQTRLNALVLSPVVPSEEDANMIQELKRCERRFGFLFRRYEDEYFWWEVVILSRKLTYGLCGTLMAAPMEQLLTMIFLLTLFAAVFLRVRPYDKASLDVMECISLISNLMVLFGGFMFYSELLSDDDAHSAAVGIQVLLVGSLLIMGMFIIGQAV